ncbi:hypothetical protein [Actinoplanes sp. NPDC051494]|uniref:hypothetical protein n=1 Tax=Actinoplanes sp. NPDC051494 TaxID=3363907 RepID=UPI0037BB6873
MSSDKKHELRVTYADGKSRKVAESHDAGKLRDQERDLRSRRVTGSSTSYTVRKKS